MRLKQKTGFTFSLDVIKSLMLQACHLLAESNDYANTPLHPRNIVLLDSFEVRIVNLKSK